MRKEYGQVLRDTFTKKMKHHLSHFQSARYPGHLYLWPGERVFRWIPCDPIHCFILLAPNPKGYDEFTVELGWSQLGRFPECGRGISRPTAEHREFSQTEFICRLSWLSRGVDIWWSVSSFSMAGLKDPVEALQDAIKTLTPDDAKRAVLPAVEDAFTQLLTHGVPYLEAFVQTTR